MTRAFWVDLAERALKTGAQAAAGVLVGTNVLAMDWQQAAAIVGTAVAASILMSLGSMPIGDRESASLVRRPTPQQIVGDLVGSAAQYLPRHLPSSSWPHDGGR